MKNSTIVVGVLAGFGVLALLSPILLIVWLVGMAAKLPGVAGPTAMAPAADLALQSEDYAEARQTFHTTLLRAGPSPQPVTEEARIPQGVQKITYSSGDLQLAAYVDGAPADGGKRPAVLFLHGGFAFGGDDLEMPQHFRDSGYIVMVPVLRGENGQPGNFTLFYDELDDVLAAAEALAALPYVDPEKLFVAGHSAGGTLAQLAAMTSPRFRAAVSFSGATNQLNQNPAFVPFDTSNISEYEMRSPLAYATSFKCPVRLYYGNLEQWIVSQTQTTADRAKQSSIDIGTEMVPGDHMSAVPESIRRSVDFFKTFAQK